MWAFVRQLLFFSVVVAVVYPMLVIAASLAYKHGHFGNVYFARGYPGDLRARVRDRTVPPPVDVLVIGSSLAYRGCDPRVFQRNGLRMFNLGSSAQRAAQGEVLLEHHWEWTSPKVVVMIVTAEMFTGGTESALDLIANDRVDVLTARMAVNMADIRVFNTLLYAGARQALDLDHEEPVLRQGRDRYVPGGYVERVDGEFITTEPVSMGAPERVHLNAFARSVAFVKAQGAALVLVHPPVAPGLRSDSSSQAVRLWSQAGRYYDMSALFDDSGLAYFSDARHLKQAGAERFSALLIDRLRVDGLVGE